MSKSGTTTSIRSIRDSIILIQRLSLHRCSCHKSQFFDEFGQLSQPNFYEPSFATLHHLQPDLWAERDVTRTMGKFSAGLLAITQVLDSSQILGLTSRRRHPSGMPSVDLHWNRSVSKGLHKRHLQGLAQSHRTTAGCRSLSITITGTDSSTSSLLHNFHTLAKGSG